MHVYTTGKAYVAVWIKIGNTQISNPLEKIVKMAANNTLKIAVKNLYRQLYHLGKEYPAGKEYFHAKLHQAFMKNKDVKDPQQIQQLIDRGNYVGKELEALYMLRKYRTLKKRYYS